LHTTDALPLIDSTLLLITRGATAPVVGCPVAIIIQSITAYLCGNAIRRSRIVVIGAVAVLVQTPT